MKTVNGPMYFGGEVVDYYEDVFLLKDVTIGYQVCKHGQAKYDPYIDIGYCIDIYAPDGGWTGFDYNAAKEKFEMLKKEKRKELGRLLPTDKICPLRYKKTDEPCCIGILCAWFNNQTNNCCLLNINNGNIFNGITTSPANIPANDITVTYC